MADEQRNQDLLKFLTRTREGAYIDIPPYAMDYIRMSDETEFGLEIDQENFTYSYCC